MVKNRNVKPVRRNGSMPGVSPKGKGKVGKKSPLKGGVRITDARQKIIQKKRKTVVDARDVLANKAKTQDARTKLQKLRGSNVKQIGKHILQKTDKNGKISLVTNKTRAANDMNSKIREQLGISSVQRQKKAPPRKQTTSGPLSFSRTISNEYHSPTMPAHGGYYHSHDMYSMPSYPTMPPVVPVEVPMSRRPVHDIVPRTMSDPRTANWNYPTPTRSNGSFMEVDSEDDCPPPPRHSSRPGASRISSNVHSRLDSAVNPPASHGILSQAKTKVVVPAGHRIVVSNLQSTVTQDDIRELFEDIGQLLVARLVRPGTAEVIYKNLKDAQKAVDTYHNRQLDGQPMKCLLVNKRPLNNPTAPAIKSNDHVRSSVSSSAKSEKLVPDLSTIHKVLFQR